MAVIANDETLDISLKFAAHKEVAQYVSPKLKAIEHSGVDGGPQEHVVKHELSEEARAMLHDVLPSLERKT